MPYVELKNRKIFYEDRGSGPAILFIHPPGMGRKTFVKQMPLEDSCRLLFPDFSGHGDSHIPITNSIVSNYVEEIEAIRKHAKIEDIFILGYSAGGIVAQEYAIQHPEYVKGLILSGGFPRVQTETLKVEHKIGILMVKYTPKLLANLLSISHFKEKLLQEEMYHHILKTNHQTWQNYYHESLTYDCTNRLSLITAPLLLIYGTRSDYINNHVRLYKKVIDTEIHFIHRANHQLPTRKSKKINRIVYQFIQKHYNIQ